MMSKLTAWLSNLTILCVSFFIKKSVLHIISSCPKIWGSRERVRLSPLAQINDATLNTASGSITIGEYTFFGHGVQILTGTHDYKSFGIARMKNIPLSGRDINIGSGVWIGSGAIVLGPCCIGDNSVIAAGAVVVAGTTIPAGTIAAGVPAKVIKQLEVN